MPELRAGPKLREQKPGTDSLDISSTRLSILALAAVYTLFVIYGSLVPLNFQHHSWLEAVEIFRTISYLKLGIASRVDWVANILLFIPLAFLWLGVLWHANSLAWRFAASVLMLLACTGLSIAIEFSQIFFPPRTVSLYDIYAETTGAGIGLLLWWMVGRAVTRWYLGRQAAGGPMSLAQRLLYGYLFLLFGYNLLPLDLTISPVELYHKWREGRLLLIPFASVPGEQAQQLYGLVTDVLIWVPAGILARLAAARNTRHIWLWLTAAAAMLEFFQLFVYTRVTDTTDILTGSLGSAVGIWIASRWSIPKTHAQQARPAGSAAGLIAAILFWLVLVFSVFWYPFDFQTDGAFVRGQLAEATTRVPFATYYFGTEYRAVTEVLHKMGFFFPLGMLLALLAGRIRSGPTPLWKIVVLAGVGIVAGAVEAGQLFLPGKFADPTDWILEMAGGWAGCALAWKIRPVHPTRFTSAISAPRHGTWWLVGGLVLGLAALLFAAPHVTALPYNLRELIAPEHPLLSALALACAVAWIFGFPAWAAAHLAAGSRGAAFLPALLLLHGIVAWVLLRIAVPLESMHDIVGAPVLGWPWEWETIGRLVGLFALWSVVSFGAGFIALRPWLPGAGGLAWACAAAAFVVLPVVYIVAIQQAATDNLTELLAGGGTPMALLWVATGLFILALAGSRLACALGSGMRVGVTSAALWAAASFPLTYLALHAGFEPYILKYNRAFSAFQFLLSQDRTHYAAPMELLLRYGFAHAALLLAIAMSQAPFLGHIALTRADQAPALNLKRQRRKKPNAGLTG